MNDLISRQAAIRWVKTECNPYGKPTLDFESGKKVIEHLEQMPSAQPNLDEWCTDCKEYDHEKHCCPRFNKVIRDTLNEVEPMRKRGTWMHDKDDVLISGYCSCCGWESIIMETDVADMPFCPNCGADMRGEQDDSV